MVGVERYNKTSKYDKSQVGSIMKILWAESQILHLPEGLTLNRIPENGPISFPEKVLKSFLSTYVQAITVN